MSFNSRLLLKSLSPKMITKAIQAFDRAMAIVVGVCWGAAVLMMVFAIYTLTLSVSARHVSDAALVAEPNLPKIVRKSLAPRETQLMVERLQHRYPEINFTLQGDQSVVVSAIDGSRFRQWLTALSYVDTIAPEFHWSLHEFCVGKCNGNEIMRAVLVGENISFEAPQSGVKN